MGGRFSSLGFAILFAFLLVHCGGEIGGNGNEVFAEEDDGASDGAPKIKSESIAGAGGDVAVDAGFASNGTAISIPTGFTASQCKFTAAAANIDGSAISTTVSINTTTGEVVCEKVVQTREEIPPETKDCVASYTVICTK